MLFWALRWHQGRRVSYEALGDLLWGEFALKPKGPGPSLRELMTYVNKRYGDKWTTDDNGRGFRISPQSHLAKVSQTTTRKRTAQSNSTGKLDSGGRRKRPVI